MSRANYQRDRERRAAQFEADLKRRVKRMQGDLQREVLRYISERVQAGEDGVVRFSVRNVRASAGVAAVVRQFAQERGRKLLNWMVRRLADLFGLNRNYFRSFTEYPRSRDEQALHLLMLRLGYNTKTGRFVPDGFLSRVFQMDEVANQLARDIQQTLAAKPTITRFRELFRDRFTRAGYVERHFTRFTSDLFHQFDRAAQTTLADELGLEHAVYSGTLIKTSRCFCERRLNRIYTREEIRKWDALEWRGKIEGGNVLIDLGGYNCRHHLSFISPMQAERMAKQRGANINSYSEHCNERTE